jgi:hypothetical protein
MYEIIISGTTIGIFMIIYMMSERIIDYMESCNPDVIFRLPMDKEHFMKMKSDKFR